MTLAKVAHSQFIVERRLAAPPATVFRAWSDPAAKRRWSLCHTDTEHHLEFRPGGRESSRVVAPDGQVHSVEAHFFDIIADRRIVYAYGMQTGDVRLSASLVTVAFEPDGAGTRLTFTEQVALFDGGQSIDERIRGTELGLDRLQLELMTAGELH